MRFTTLVPLMENPFNPLASMGVRPNLRTMVKDEVTRLNFIISRGMDGWEAFLTDGMDENIMGRLEGQWIQCTTSATQEHCLARLAEHLDAGEEQHTSICDPIHNHS